MAIGERQILDSASHRIGARAAQFDRYGVMASYGRRRAALCTSMAPTAGAGRGTRVQRAAEDAAWAAAMPPGAEGRARPEATPTRAPPAPVYGVFRGRAQRERAAFMAGLRRAAPSRGKRKRQAAAGATKGPRRKRLVQAYLVSPRVLDALPFPVMMPM